ncbi:unnamed protein product [Mycena citricolor]|uniref:Uncharacterized protein n=1 Tax=Mycena citricolor TaxID=2018698 RepID=A0AAD2HLH8_9AGAR|nr:unnamed protein product [Mycena citricolor]
MNGTEKAGMNGSLALHPSHPLAEELVSLRTAATRFQNEAHAASIKLQRHALDTSALTDRVAHLEDENALLRTELGVFRDTSGSASYPGDDRNQETVAELTLSLRRLNAKLSLTESALEEHTRTLAEKNTVAAQSTRAAGEAYALAARARGREEEERVRSQALERQVAQAREETKLVDRVVTEYAALVRSMTVDGGRSPAPSATGFDDGESAARDTLNKGKAQLEGLTSEFSQQIVALEARIAVIENERDVANAELAASKTLNSELGTELARSKFSAIQSLVDDRSAAGMVERYMKFTQQTTSSLHDSLKSLRSRHEATLSTLQGTLSATQSQLQLAQSDVQRLRDALDEAGGALVRETVGRRREVAVRMKVVGREERAVESLRSAIGRAETHLPESDPDLPQTKSLLRLVSDVRDVLKVLDAGDSNSSSHAGTEGRMLLLENAIEMMASELDGEVRRRIAAERMVDERREDGSVPNIIQPSVAPSTSNADLSPDTIISIEPKPEPQPEPQPQPEPDFSSSPTQPDEADSPDKPATPIVVESAVPPAVFTAESPEFLAQEPADGLQDVFVDSPEPLAVAEITADEVRIVADTPEPVSMVNKLSFPVLSDPDVEPSTIVTPELISETGGIAFPILSHPAPQNPLLDDLEAASQRYDALQRAFRDCHLVLQELRAALEPPSADEVLRSAVERLHDYTEDARVELEICVADGRVLARGWQTMVLLPASGEVVSLENSEEIGNIERQIEAFVERDAKALLAFQRKLEDVEHDVAIVKQAIYAPPSTSSESTPPPEKSEGGGRWTSWLHRSPESPPSPVYSESPTFGNVMTTPRLRHSSSSLRSSLKRETSNPFESLGLRVPMPSYIPQQVPTMLSPGTRQRTISGVYMLGLGVGHGGRRPSGLGLAVSPAKTEQDSDVE